jgi:glycosyltransferase involved in cell wall biosynthesis
MGKAFAREAEKQLRGGNFDLVFSPGSIPIAYLETKTPIAFWTDANFQAMIGYYYMDLSAETISDGNLMEKAALERSTHAIYSSDWAANGAIDFYQVNPSKVSVVPFGANVSDVPVPNDLRRKLRDKELKLLFVGKDWERKGGSLAFETMTSLNQRGVRTSLTVVGCVPPAAFSDQRMEVIPFLDKNKPQDAARLRRLYLEADFFIMPSRKDCSPIVLCEAAAFGLPVLSADTGGIRTIVRDGVSGFVLPLEAAGADYAEKVMGVVETKGAYDRLSVSARQRYDDVLNWDAAGKELNRLLVG